MIIVSIGQQQESEGDSYGKWSSARYFRGGKNVQSGTVEWRQSFSDDGTKSLGSVTFSKAFSKTPKLLVQLTSSDFDSDWNVVTLNLVATSISTTGFTATIEVNYFGRGSSSYAGTFDWCAYEE